MTDFLPTCETLLVQREGSRLHLTLNRPQVRNALNPLLIAEMSAVFGALSTRSDIKSVVLRGAGGTFCAGADLKNMESRLVDECAQPGGKDPVAVNNRQYGEFLCLVNSAPQTVIAAVEGHAIAGGFGLVCAADIAIITEECGFSLSETALGIVPAQIAPFVAARVGVAQTRHLALTAARFKGAEAVRLGVGQYLVRDSAALDTKLEEVLRQVDRCAPLANALTKQILLRVGTEPLSATLDFAADCFATARRSPQAAEGLRAFAEKRAPSWVKETA